jgi:uncharacterized protein YoxC
VTPEEIHREVRDLRERIEDLENEREAIKRLPTAVAELKGAVHVLQDLVVEEFGAVRKGVDNATGMKTAIQFAAVVLVPVIVALIGGYFVLRVGLAGSK